MHFLKDSKDDHRCFSVVLGCVVYKARLQEVSDNIHDVVYKARLQEVSDNIHDVVYKARLQEVSDNIHQIR